jgi:hypothetical protein
MQRLTLTEYIGFKLLVSYFKHHAELETRLQVIKAGNLFRTCFLYEMGCLQPKTSINSLKEKSSNFLINFK